jgi:hypothetical protein
LKIDGSLLNVRIASIEEDDARNIRNKRTVNIPGGEQLILADYTGISNRGRIGANDLRINYDFKPGYKYELYEVVSGNKVWLQIEEIGLRAFKSFYVAPEIRLIGVGFFYGPSMSFTGTNLIGFGSLLNQIQIGIVIDGNKQMGFFAETNGFIGINFHRQITNFEPILSSGVSYELYFSPNPKRTTIGLGVGAGIMWTLDMFSANKGALPYVRSSLQTLDKGNHKAKYYVDYYFGGKGQEIWNRFGMGILWMI